MDKIEKIKQALSDPQAPWYGSDLVEWVAELLADLKRHKGALELISIMHELYGKKMKDIAKQALNPKVKP